MAKRLAAGAEIDAWCTKCKLDLGHRIVAMVGDGPKRVICMTCNSEHNFRSPKSAEKKAPAAKTKAKAAPKRGIAAAAAKEATRIAEWESRTGGASPTEFTKYAISVKLAEGELVSHVRFGAGYVAAIVDDKKVQVMFRDGPRTLVHGQNTG